MWAYLDGKKTYIAAAITAVLGLLGVSDEVIAASPEGIANGVGIVLAAAATMVARYKATTKKPNKKTRKPRQKKVKVENA